MQTNPPETRNDMSTRDSILGLLSDEEVARVSTAEGAAHLVDGDEYLDLERLDQGVLKAMAQAQATPMGQVLPRKSVTSGTWTKVLGHLGRPAAH